MGEPIQKILQWLRTKVNTPWRAFRSYLLFALVNTLAKIIYARYHAERGSKRLRMAGIEGKGIDPIAKEISENAHRMHDYRTEYLSQYDYRKHDFVHLPAPQPAVAAWSPSAIEFILKSEFDNVTKPLPEEDHLFYLLKQFIGPGIFTLRHGKSMKDAALSEEHGQWFTQRKTTSMIFTKGNFNTLISTTFQQKIVRLIEVMHNHIDAVEEKDNKEFDIQKSFFAYTMDSVQSIFFGRESDTIGGRDDALADSYDGAHLNMMRYIYKNIPLIILSGLLPWPFAGLASVSATDSVALRAIEMRSPEYQEFSRQCKVLDRELYSVVQELRDNRSKVKSSSETAKKQDRSNQKKNNLVALFLDNPEFSNEELRSVMGNLIIAGRDTTACTLSWMMYELTQNPEIQDKLYKEACDKLSSKNGGKLTIPSYDDLSAENMPYLNGVVYETLRLHPAVPDDVKISMKDLKMPDGRVIPKGTRMFYSTYAMGRDPHRYPDPLKFNPDRWIPFTKPSDFEFPVFQGGPRFCLGRHMAMYEMKLVMSVLMQEFTFKLKEGEKSKINYTLFITMSVSNSKDSTNIDRNSMELLVIPERRQNQKRVPEVKR